MSFITNLSKSGIAKMGVGDTSGAKEDLESGREEAIRLDHPRILRLLEEKLGKLPPKPQMMLEAAPG